MTDNSWQQAVELFERAAEVPEAERSAWLQERCPDPEVRAEVEAMLRGDEASLGFLDRPEVLLKPDLLEGPEAPGTRIGPYVLVELLGEGGMGTVWAAEQERPLRRAVALKLIKPGMDTRQVLSRFESERQVLARMEHPHIARVHDAGTTDAGRPYFVMERVDGPPLTTWCNARELEPRDRVRLFLPVCEAVQHAHHKGVIHRDLKPSNLLVAEVDGSPHPKVIDFGIAKLVHPEGGEEPRTRLGARIGTPTYMSPEQVAGRDVDTRTDVYALGAVLYELLTGEPPLDVASLTPAEAEERIRDEIPPTPSRRTRETRAGSGPSPASEGAAAPTPDRELDWIVMKALEKDPERRYATPHELAEDLRRYLASEPVLAGPPSRIYRARTFVRRHRTAVVLAAAALLSLVLGLVGTTWMALEARRARSEAEREARSARAVSGFLAEILSSADPLETADDIPARELRVAEVLHRARERLGTADGMEPFVEASLRAVLGRTFLGLEMFSDAEPELETALTRFRELLGDDHPETLAVAHDRARLHASLGEYDEAKALYEATAEARRRVLGPDHLETLGTLSNLGEMRVVEGDLAAAEGVFREVLASLRVQLGDEHRRTVTALNNLGFVLRRRGEPAEAEALYREALRLNRKLVGDAHPHTIAALNNLGALLVGENRIDEAADLFAEALELAIPVHGETGSDTLNIRSSLAAVQRRQGRLEKAESQFRSVVDGYRATLGPEHPHTLRNRNNLARVMAERGDVDGALAIYDDLLPITDRVLPEGHAWRWMFRAGHAKVLHGAGDDDRARIELREAVPRLEAALGAEHPSTASAAELLEELGG